MDKQVSERVVAQRIRNRFIEVLEELVDWQETLATIGAIEYFESFFDWIRDDRIPDLSTFTEPERLSLSEVLRLMLAACDDTSPHVTEQELANSHWPAEIAKAAKAALDLMLTRGKFGEDWEEVAPADASRP